MAAYSPDLTFACELEAPRLQTLFANPEVIPFLQRLNATVSLGILDLSDQRAEIVRMLNEAGIPVIAWLLLPKDQGYWFNLDNYPQAIARYEKFREWTLEQGLRWARIGLDIEPDIRAMQALTKNRWSALTRLTRDITDQPRLRKGRQAYHQLIEQIHADGYQVEVYQIPFIIDDRMAHSSLLQRLAGLVDLPEADREVLMLYSSFMRPWGQGVLWSYGFQARSIGVGITGGGVELEGALATRPMNWPELQNDLLLARRHTENIFIFSLEGCVEQNFLPLILEMDWQDDVKLPVLYFQRTERFRRLARRILWLFSKPAWMLFALALAISTGVLVARQRRR